MKIPMVFGRKLLGRNAGSMSSVQKTALKTLRWSSIGSKFIMLDKVEVISNNSDRIKSQRLLYREYSKRDLCEENWAGLYFNPYTFLPTTTTLVSKRKEEVMGTISAIGDSEHGLPADTLYHEELNVLRGQGRRLVEISCLALDSRKFKSTAYSLGSVKKFSSMCAVFTGLVNYVYANSKATDLVILVNPKHRGIYDFIGFEEFANIKLYPFVNKPAVPLIIPIERLINDPDTCPISNFIRKNYPILRPSRKIDFHTGDIEWYLTQASEQFSRMTAEDHEKLKAIFPNFKWSNKSAIKQQTEAPRRSNTVELINSIQEADQDFFH